MIQVILFLVCVLFSLDEEQGLYS